MRTKWQSNSGKLCCQGQFWDVLEGHKKGNKVHKWCAVLWPQWTEEETVDGGAGVEIPVDGGIEPDHLRPPLFPQSPKLPIRVYKSLVLTRIFLFSQVGNSRLRSQDGRNFSRWISHSWERVKNLISIDLNLKHEYTRRLCPVPPRIAVASKQCLW